MAINTKFGGKSSPVQKEVGICWYAEATEAETLYAQVLSRPDLSDVEGLTEAGGIHPDGITIENEQGDTGGTEILRDWSGNKFDEVTGEDSEEGSNTISFTLLEVLNPNAMKLVYKNVITDLGFGDDDYVSRISGTEKPTDKFIVVEYAIKENIIREVFPSCSFAGRDSFTIANSELAAHGVTYNIKDSGLKDYYKIVFRPTES